MGEASHPSPVDTQLDSPEERATPAGSTVPASPHALRRAGAPMVEPSDSVLSGTRRLSLMWLDSREHQNWTRIGSNNQLLTR